MVKGLCTCIFQFTRQEYAELVKVVGREDYGAHLSWLFTALPTILLAAVFVLWCVAFILVIILFPDNSAGEPRSFPNDGHQVVFLEVIYQTFSFDTILIEQDLLGLMARMAIPVLWIDTQKIQINAAQNSTHSKFQIDRIGSNITIQSFRLLTAGTLITGVGSGGQGGMCPPLLRVGGKDMFVPPPPLSDPEFRPIGIEPTDICDVTLAWLASLCWARQMCPPPHILSRSYAVVNDSFNRFKISCIVYCLGTFEKLLSVHYPCVCVLL